MCFKVLLEISLAKDGPLTNLRHKSHKTLANGRRNDKRKIVGGHWFETEVPKHEPLYSLMQLQQNDWEHENAHRIQTKSRFAIILFRFGRWLNLLHCNATNTLEIQFSNQFGSFSLNLWPLEYHFFFTTFSTHCLSLIPSNALFLSLQFSAFVHSSRHHPLVCAMERKLLDQMRMEKNFNLQPLGIYLRQELKLQIALHFTLSRFGFIVVD